MGTLSAEEIKRDIAASEHCLRFSLHENYAKILRILGGKPFLVSNGNLFTSSGEGMYHTIDSGREISKMARVRLRIADRFLRKNFIALMFKTDGEEYVKDYYHEMYTDLVDGLEHPRW